LKFHYNVFGLCLCSEIELAGLQSAGPDMAPDVTIERGSFPAKPGWRVVDGIFQLAIPKVAAYEVRRNGTIIVDPCEASDPEAVQRALLGKVMAAIAYQRSELPLHAATIAADGRLIAVAGRSRHGKSTLVSSLAQSGYEVVSDDLLLLRTPAGRLAEAMPGTTRLRLDLEAAGMTKHPTRRDEPTDAIRPKKYVATPHARVACMRPLAAIYRLEWGSPAIDPMPVSDRIMRLADITHMWSLREKLGDPDQIRRAAFSLVTQIPMFSFSRPRQTADLRATTTMLEKHCRGLHRENRSDRPAFAVEKDDGRRYFA
jgi:hypothetical protein